MLHGAEALAQVVQASEKLFGGAVKGLSDEELSKAFDAAPRTAIKLSELEEGLGLIDMLVKTGLAQGRGAAKRLIKQGGAYLNNEVVKSLERGLGTEDLASEHFIVLRAGKKNYHLLHLEK